MESVQPILVIESYPAPIETIWRAITNPVHFKAWYFDIQDFKLKVGSTFHFTEPGGDTFLHECTILEIIENQKFKHTWSYPKLAKGITEVTWELENTQHLSVLTLTHSGTEIWKNDGAAFARENFMAGWQEILGVSLKGFLRV